MGTSDNFETLGAKIARINKPAAKRTPSCCSSCEKKAHFFVTQVDSAGNVISKSFCLSHAYRAGLMHPKAWDLLGDIAAVPRPVPSELSCRCGMTQSALKQKGRVGCNGCYETFKKFIAPALSRIHRAPVHTGKRPHAQRALSVG